MNYDKNAWATPQAVYDFFNERFNFGLDACANKTNHKHENFYTIEQDALIQDWSEYNGGRVYDVWCNPPYGRGLIKQFINKAIKEAVQNGVKTLLFVPNTPDAGWIDWEHVAEVYFITHGRIAFINPATGETVKGNTKGSMALLINPEHRGQTITHYIKRGVIMNEDPHG